MIVCPSKHDSFRRVKPTTLISYSNFNAGDPLRAFFSRNADFWNKFPSGCFPEICTGKPLRNKNHLFYKFSVFL